MFKKVDISCFNGLKQESDPVKRFSIKYPADEDLFAQSVWKYVVAYSKFGHGDEAYKIMFVDDSKNTFEHEWFFMSAKQFKQLKRWNQHCVERVENGASFRDAWDVNAWLVTTMPNILKSLHENTHGYPSCAISLWNKLTEITGADEPIDEVALISKATGKPAAEIDINDEYFSHPELDKVRSDVWRKAIERLEFLFKECCDETCSMKNPYEFKWNYETKKTSKTLYELVWNGTGEEKIEHDNYMNYELAIDRYKSDCLHKALKILDVFIEHLWD